MEQKFFRCKHCGNVVAFVYDAGVPLMCCGEDMEEVVANTSDGAKEKHVPVLVADGNLVTVTVGTVAHPMTAEHLIEWISLETKFGEQRKKLKAGDPPVATFALTDGDVPIKAYAYCNLHDLFVTK